MIRTRLCGKFRNSGRFASKLLVGCGVMLAGAAIALADPWPREVLVYHFDEGSGVVALDSSGNGYDGTIVGATYVPGISGTALHFDAGSSQSRVEVPRTLFSTLANTFYVEAWIRQDQRSPGAHSDFCQSEIFRKRAPHNDWMLTVTRHGQAGCLTGGGGVYGGYVPLDEWTKVSCGYDGHNLRLSINGDEVASLEVSMSIDWYANYIRTEVGNNTYDWGINCRDYGFFGAIDELVILDAPPPRVPPTPEELIVAATDEIVDLVDTGILTGGQGNALAGKLDDALAKFNSGKTKPALNKLNAFINQVTALIADGTLTQADGDALIAAAQAIIDAIILGG